MPELPEVQTTVSGLSRVIIGKTIKEIWSDFHINTAHGERKNIKNKKYFDNFKKLLIGSRIKSIERRGKHIIINLSNSNSIIVHMKMTGHLMVGRYKKLGSVWLPVEDGPLKDPYNKFIHLVISLSDGKHLVLSDMRKFASVCVVKTDGIDKHPGILELGPDPLKITDPKQFRDGIKSKRNWPIKAVLMNQEVLAGIGNIYSDEILWTSSVHPLSRSNKIPDKVIDLIFKNSKIILKKSISLGGDSMSDYRNVFGERGGFQNIHKVYRKIGTRCTNNNCKNKISAIIKRIVVKGRSAHFCPIHQVKY